MVLCEQQLNITYASRVGAQQLNITYPSRVGVQQLLLTTSRRYAAHSRTICRWVDADGAVYTAAENNLHVNSRRAAARDDHQSKIRGKQPQYRRADVRYSVSTYASQAQQLATTAINHMRLTAAGRAVGDTRPAATVAMVVQTSDTLYAPTHHKRRSLRRSRYQLHAVHSCRVDWKCCNAMAPAHLHSTATRDGNQSKTHGPQSHCRRAGMASQIDSI